MISFGDTASISIVLVNQTDKPLPVSVALRAHNATILYSLLFILGTFQKKVLAQKETLQAGLERRLARDDRLCGTRGGSLPDLHLHARDSALPDRRRGGRLRR